ncbi:hypothetical protein [Actinomadura violacea]|uniref:Uncharacterized protein n=1 Tax=Actinomadura violacea TaxID=2819934 RepID=A0ABS3RR74_9ACTN|nr:hypothetical protein [Actinomadura violacea]MBO2459244.1 hypothetical protein [Actinomadura violacea]
MAGWLDRLRGSAVELPSDAVAAAGAVDPWPYGECSYVLTLAATGPLRVAYSLTEPAGPSWLRLVEVSERRRRRVLGAALMSGALAGAGLADGRPVGGPGPVSAHGWVHVGGYSRSAWVPLGADRGVGGVLLADMLADLVPRGTWRELDTRRCEAWAAWAQRTGSVPQVRTAGMEQTRRDWREAPAAGPEGLPGIRHGGGLGGAW